MKRRIVSMMLVAAMGTALLVGIDSLMKKRRKYICNITT